MSSKPLDIATWTGTPVAPSAGKRTAGFLPGEKPPAQYFDYLFGLAGQWQQWLSDGDCAFHNLSANGLTTLTGGIALTGGAAVDTLTVSGTAGITGLLTASGGITVPTAKSVVLNGTTGLTVGTDGIVNNGPYKQGTDTIVVYAGDAASANVGSAWSYNSQGDNWLSVAASNLLTFPIRLPVGRRLLTVTFWYQRNSGTLLFDCFTSALTTGSRTSAINQVTVNSGTAITSVILTAGGGGHVVTSAEQLFAMCTSGSTADRCYAIVVTYDYP